jgi:uncharacterized membrane protein YecN with MAPEG domain
MAVHMVGEMAIMTNHVTCVGPVKRAEAGRPAGMSVMFQIHLTGGEVCIYFANAETAKPVHDNLLSALQKPG